MGLLFANAEKMDIQEEHRLRLAFCKLLIFTFRIPDITILAISTSHVFHPCSAR